MKGKCVLSAAAALAVAAAVVLGAQAPAQADAAQMAAVKERQELMKAIGGNAKTITDFLKESKGSKEEAQAAAAKIGELAGQIPEAFEVEASLSEMDAVGKNRGKPEIWLSWEEFTGRAETLQEKAEALASSFDGDMAGVQAAFGDMGKNGCGSCHDDFRGPKVE
ncbi:MAG: c-type cytochrome [Bacteroidota bacterium]|nr:cytochrome c [Kiloniellaceae bacterium]